MIMLMVVLGFVLKLSLHSWGGILATSAVAASFTLLACSWAVDQSSAAIASWLQSPELMLDTAVVLTVDVVLQIAFCVLMGAKVSGSLSRCGRVVLPLIFWFPGLLIFPVLFALLVETVFLLPGVDFTLIAWCAAGAVLLFCPLPAFLMQTVLPEKELRLELIFFINLIIAGLGIIATVNGRPVVNPAG